MDWESLYCPNRRCRYYGRPFLHGLLVKNGSSHGQKQARCQACETPVSIRYGTAYLALHAESAIFEMAVRALAEGNAIRATARIVQVDKDAVCTWLDRAAQHCRLVMLSLWRTSMSLHASWTNSGALCIPSNTGYRLLGSMMRPMAMRGCGSPLAARGGLRDR